MEGERRVAKGVPAGLSRGEARRFGLLVGAAFLVLGAVLSWRDRPLPALICGAAGAVLILLGAALPDALGPVHRAWMGLAGAISKVTTPIFMGVVYFGVLTPIGLIRRMVGGNPLKPRVKDRSLWVGRERESKGPEDLEHQF
jgi:hypothetical protein